MTGAEKPAGASGKARTAAWGAKALAAVCARLRDKASGACQGRPVVLAVLAAVALVGMVALLFWYLVLSGFAQPIQFIYSSF